MRLFSPRKTTLLLVIRDKTKVSTVLETETHNFVPLLPSQRCITSSILDNGRKSLSRPLHAHSHAYIEIKLDQEELAPVAFLFRKTTVRHRMEAKS